MADVARCLKWLRWFGQSEGLAVIAIITNITPEHRGAFKALTSKKLGKFKALSCFIHGPLGAAMVRVNQWLAG